jgi:ATP-binding cassette, subfamily B, bacterial CvaB/MchF/RaxB
MSAADIGLLDLGLRGRMPFIRQSESAECGLACLAMVGGVHKHKTDLLSLRHKFSLSLKGMPLRSLMKVADDMGFNSRPLRGEIDDLVNIPLPAVLHWDLNHFVVLSRIKRGFKGKQYIVYDPARGILSLNRDMFSKHWTGIILELQPSEHFVRKRECTRLRISQLWSNIDGLIPTLTQVFLLSLLLQCVALASPFYLQLAIDTVLPAFDTDLLLMLALGFGGLTLVNLVIGMLRSTILLNLGSAIGYQIVVNLFRQLMRLPAPWFEKRHVGDIVSRFGSAQPISNLLAQQLIAAVIDGLMSIATLILMFVYAPTLAMLALVALTLYALIRLASLSAMRMMNENAIAAQAAENSTFIESVRGITALKLFAREGDRQRLWQNHKAESVNASLQLGRLSIGFDVANQAVMGLENIFFVYIAIKSAVAGDFTTGMIFAYLSYKQQFLSAAIRLINQAIDYRMLDVHLERIADIVLTATEPNDSVESNSQAPLTGALELRNVCFKYAQNEPQVLKDVDIKIGPGEIIAIVGSSGGGKTTLIKLMLGLFEPVQGEVLVNGIPLSRYGRKAYRRQIGAMMQDDVLYAGSIAENIAFFEPDMDMSRVIASAKTAMIHEEIIALPMQYESLVGDMGSALSGGQKQRVLLARALYPQPTILFMDEGTAHLDVHIEAAVNARIQALGEERTLTRIIIAHRPETIRSASRVLALVNGRIIEVTAETSEAEPK